MGMANFIGITICVFVFMLSFLLGKGVGLYFNIIGILVVLSGTLGAAFLSYPFSRLKAAFFVAMNTYSVTLPSSDIVVNSLLDLSVRSKYDGILSLEKAQRQSYVAFLKDALSMLVDGYTEEELRDVLSNEMYFFKQRRIQNERVFRMMSRAAPAFGIVGSVIGLIGMLTGIGDMGVILKTIPIALTSTLYGIVFSNFILTPIAENMHARTQEELVLQNLIVNGVIAIGNEQNPHRLEKKLVSFLTPAARRGHGKSFEEIRKKYLKLRFSKKQEKTSP